MKRKPSLWMHCLLTKRLRNYRSGERMEIGLQKGRLNRRWKAELNHGQSFLVFYFAFVLVKTKKIAILAGSAGAREKKTFFTFLRV